MNKESDYSEVRHSGLKYTGYLIDDHGLAQGHNGFLFSGTNTSNRAIDEPEAKDIIRKAGSTKGLFNSKEFLFD